MSSAARSVAVIALLSLLLTGCVSREDNSGAQQAPETVPLTESVRPHPAGR